MTHDRKPSVLHYLDQLDPRTGGVVAHVSDLAVLCAERGVRVCIATSHEHPRPERLDQKPGPDIVPLGPPGLGGILLSGSQLDRLFELASGFDVMHLHGAWNVANLQIASRARRLGKPYVTTPHGMLDDWCMQHRGWKKKGYMALFGKKYYAGAELVLYCAEGELQQSSPWTAGTPGRVIPAATDLAPYQDLPGPDRARQSIAGAQGDEPVVLFLSRIDPKKGLEVLIDAAGLLADHASGFRLLIAGTGEPEYVAGLRKRADRAGIGDRTHFIGHVSGEDKVSLYQRANVLALPTKQENFGLVLTESLAAETPVVTTKGVDIWPELESCGGGRIVEGTPEAFADTIGELLEAPDICEEMGRRGREWVMQDLDPDVLAEKFLDAYSLAASHNP